MAWSSYASQGNYKERGAILGIGKHSEGTQMRNGMEQLWQEKGFQEAHRAEIRSQTSKVPGKGTAV